MPAQEGIVANDPGLERLVERQIIQRTWGRIHRLAVELAPERVIVRGWTSSYYVKQLALVAIREVLQELPVELDIKVGSGEPRATQGIATAGAGLGRLGAFGRPSLLDLARRTVRGQP